MYTQKIAFSLLAFFIIIAGSAIGVVTHKKDFFGNTLVSQTRAEAVTAVVVDPPTTTTTQKKVTVLASTTSNDTKTLNHRVATAASTTALYSITPNTEKISKPIRVLVVAGHEPTYGGAEYRNLKERNMTLAVSEYLRSYFASNPKFEVIVVRDQEGWSPLFSSYFQTNATATKNFYLSHRALMSQQVANGEIIPFVGVPHNAAPEAVALHLYGINAWANEHDIDVVLHLHFNDAPRQDASVPGKYSGVALYVPEHQYKNSSTSKAIARSVFPYLVQYSATSTLPTESLGIIEDQELIALGKYNTLNVPSLLIEYGYIYENKFQNPAGSDVLFKQFALETYAGVVQYFAGAQ